jgi:hypothetical protein
VIERRDRADGIVIREASAACEEFSMITIKTGLMCRGDAGY